jgi:hypothetical protein
LLLEVALVVTALAVVQVPTVALLLPWALMLLVEAAEVVPQTLTQVMLLALAVLVRVLVVAKLVLESLAVRGRTDRVGE